MEQKLFVASMVLVLMVTTSLVHADRARKKLIQYGWGVPTTAFVRANIERMESQYPFFDGVVIKTQGGWKAYPVHVFRKTPFDRQEFVEDLNNLQATEFRRFTENFILMWATREKDWDWFNDGDWRSAEYNARRLAYVAKAGKCVGICFDPEPYNGNPWHYPTLPNASSKSFADYWTRVRECGARFMKALQREFPNIRILTFFWCSLFDDIVDIPDPKERMERLSKHHYGLLPAFLNGMLDAANERVVIIDGNEPAYYYREPEQYFRAYHLMKQRALSLIAPENHRKYTLQVQAGFALYMDLYFGLVPFDYTWGRIGHFLKPEEKARWLEHNAYYALLTSDEYVWCYSEHMDWWGTQENSPWHHFVPEGAVDALQSAKQRVEQGKPLGFSVREMLTEAQKRVDETTGK